MEGKLLLKKLAEETIYSAKGHFKACDLRRTLVSWIIWLCAILNVITLIGINPVVDKWLAAAALFGLIALLIWNEGEGKNYRVVHKQFGETYLALHKEIRTCYYLTDCTKEQIQELCEKVSQFDQKGKPDIPWFARRWARKAIEEYDETDNWFRE
jgi:hypothetical protein